MNGNKGASIPVAVELETRHQGGKPDVRRYSGLLYGKPRGQYLVYEEEAESGQRIRTMIRWDGAELKLVRSGAIESEQTFAAGRDTAGTYRLPQGTFALEARTEELRVEAGAAGGSAAWPRPVKATVFWRYALKLGGEPAGNFEIRLTIWEEQ